MKTVPNLAFAAFLCAVSVPMAMSAPKEMPPASPKACNPGNAVFCDNGSGKSVPELDAAGLPLVAGLTAALVLWGRERKRRQ